MEDILLQSDVGILKHKYESETYSEEVSIRLAYNTELIVSTFVKCISSSSTFIQISSIILTQTHLIFHPPLPGCFLGHTGCYLQHLCVLNCMT